MRVLDRLADTAARLPLPGEVRFARMSGSSIAAPSAMGWVVDFLNAAYFARPRDARDVDDLRLAWAVLTTRWARLGGRRLTATDVVAFHRAYGLRRLRSEPRGTLDRDALLEGGAALVGGWFADAVLDPARRAHGIAFPTVAEREAFDPARRRRFAALGPLTPPVTEPAGQHWKSYPAVALPDPAAAVALLLEPARWPDVAADGGRFTALRAGGLAGQTFEIEVFATPAPRVPIYTRGYVTCTALRHAGDPELPGSVAALNETLSAHGEPGGEVAVPAGAEPLLAVELTTHDSHFLGRAVSRLVAFRDERGGWVRDVGSWDRLPWYIGQAYELAGRGAQAAFWGPEPPEGSMLAQLARVSARA